MIYYPTGQIQEQVWWVNSKLHRKGGKPAIIRYWDNGQIHEQQWWINGVKLTDLQVIHMKRKPITHLIHELMLVNRKEKMLTREILPLVY